MHIMQTASAFSCVNDFESYMIFIQLLFNSMISFLSSPMAQRYLIMDTFANGIFITINKTDHFQCEIEISSVRVLIIFHGIISPVSSVHMNMHASFFFSSLNFIFFLYFKSSFCKLFVYFFN